MEGGRCYSYGKPGQKYPSCRTKEKIPKYQWVVNKSQQHVYSHNYNDKNTIRSSLSRKKEDPVIGWSGFHFTFMQVANIK